MRRDLRLAIISYHYLDQGNTRPETLRRALVERLKVQNLSIFHADFEHISKRQLSYPNDANLRAIPCPAYSKNISFRRVWSHLVFCFRLFLALRPKKFDVIYICIPPTSSLLLLLYYRLVCRKVVMVDVVDLWPEAIPLRDLKKKIFNLSIGYLWAAARNICLRRASLVLANNQYFLSKLRLPAQKTALLYLTNQSQELEGLAGMSRPDLSECLHICFLGSLNHITDLESLIEVLTELHRRRPVFFEILGGGERATELKQALLRNAIPFQDHGISFDPALKCKVLGRSHFAYNGYRASTEVALSYKSIDYLAAGLPLINSAKGDLREFISSYQCGVNFDPNESSLQHAISVLAGLEAPAYLKMSRQARLLYEDKFTEEKFSIQLSRLLEKVCEVNHA